MDRKTKIGAAIFLVVFVLVIGILVKVVLFTDYTKQEKEDDTGSIQNEKPALTLKSDKQAESKEKEKEVGKEKDKKKEDKKKEVDKEDKKKEDKVSSKQLETDAKDNAIKTLEIQAKPKGDFEKESTQSIFKNVATTEYVDKHQENNTKDNRTVSYENVSLDIKDKELSSTKAKGTLKFDRLINPKSKNSKVKPSTEVDSKVLVTFKKVNNTFKVDSIQS